MDTFTEALLKLLEPMDYSGTSDLEIYLTGLGDIFQIVEDWASDTDEGQPGYSLLLDINRIPDEALPWLGQFVGVQVTLGLDPAIQRAQILGLGSWKRGTVESLQAAPLEFLTGSKTVIVHERDTDPYHFQVVTLGSETPDSASVLVALLRAKPAGLVMDYTVNTGQKAFLIRDSILRPATTPDSLRLSL